MKGEIRIEIEGFDLGYTFHIVRGAMKLERVLTPPS